MDKSVFNMLSSDLLIYLFSTLSPVSNFLFGMTCKHMHSYINYNLRSHDKLKEIFEDIAEQDNVVLCSYMLRLVKGKQYKQKLQFNSLDLCALAAENGGFEVLKHLYILGYRIDNCGKRSS